VPHRAGARDGTAAPARRSARRGPVHARGVGFDRRGGKRPYYPLHRASEAHPSTGLERHLPRPANGQGYGGHFPSGCSLPRFKRMLGRRGTDAKPPTLLGVFHSPPPCLRRLGGRRRRAATASRRAREEPGAGPEQGQLRRQERRRPAKDIAFNRRSWEGEKVVHVGEGSRTGAGTRTSPGTPTSPRHRRSRPGYDYTAAPT
jgi:hypothetical protein